MKKLIIFLILLLFCNTCFGVIPPLHDPFAAHLGWVNPKHHFGAVGNGNANDTNAIQAALASMVDGDKFYLPPGDYKTTSVIEVNDLSNCEFDFAGTIRPVGCSGITFENVHSSTIAVKRVVRATFDWGVGNYWGVKFTEVNYCKVHVNSSLYFTYGLYFDANNGKGICYNNFTFERVTAKYGLYFSATNGGWINANNYTGGRLYLDSNVKNSKITYEITGTLSPDIEGTYAYSWPLYNDKPAYKLDGQEWYIWWDDVDTWHISTVKGTVGDNYWSRSETTIPGTYSPTGGSGNAEVAGIETGAWGIYFADSPSHTFHDHSFYGVTLESLFNGIRFSTNYNTLLARTYFEAVDANHISVGVRCDNLTWILGADSGFQLRTLDRTKLDINNASFDHFTIIGRHPDKESCIIIDGSDEGGIVAADPADSLAALGRIGYDKTNDYWKFEDNVGVVGTLTAGGTTDYVEFDSDGFETMYGKARISRHLYIGAEKWKKGVSAPTDTYENILPTITFADGQDDVAHYSEIVPYRWDNTTDMEVAVKWKHDTVAKTGNVLWKLDYIGVADGDNPAGAGTEISQLSAGSHAKDEQITTYFATDISAANLERGDTLGLKLWRDGDDETDDMDEGAELIAMHIHYTMNRLGGSLEIAPENVIYAGENVIYAGEQVEYP